MPDPDDLSPIDDLIDEINEDTASLSRTTLAWEERLVHLESQNLELKSKIDVQNEKIKWAQWVAVIFVTVMIFLAGTVYFDMRELRGDLAGSRERLAVLETIHSEQYFRPVHSHPEEPACELMPEVEVSVS